MDDVGRDILNRPAKFPLLNPFLLQQMIAVAELEAGMISARTKASAGRCQEARCCLGRRPRRAALREDTYEGQQTLTARADQRARGDIEPSDGFEDAVKGIQGS